jgi:hypothetical protein
MQLQDYKEPSIILGIGAATWSKINYEPIGPITHRVVLPCTNIQHCLRFCLDHLNRVKMAAFVLSSIEETEKSRVGGG